MDAFYKYQRDLGMLVIQLLVTIPAILVVVSFPFSHFRINDILMICLRRWLGDITLP
jgi:hypothetical protein